LKKLTTVYRWLRRVFNYSLARYREENLFWNGKDLLTSLILIFLVLWLYQMFKAVFDTYFVEKLLSRLPFDALGVPLSVLYCSIIFAFGTLLFKRFNPSRFQLTSKSISVLIITGAIYWKERYTGSYTLIYLFDGHNIALTDPIFLFALFLGGWYLITSVGLRRKVAWSPLFTRDIAIDKFAYDQLDRQRFVNNLANQVKSLKFKAGGSMVIGLEGSWGSGKSSTMKMMADRLASDDTFSHIPIPFNAWIANNNSNMIQDFFDTLEDSLSRYIATGNIFKKYGRELTQIDDDRNPLRAFASFFTDSALQQRFATLTHLIEKINQPVIVYLDDIDRLNNIEVFDMLKLIRSSSSFPNMLFIVAYDREFIELSLEKLNIPHSKTYLQKIVNIEVQLPVIKPNIITGLLVNELKDKVRQNIQPMALRLEAEGMVTDLVLGRPQAHSSGKYQIDHVMNEIFKNKRDIIRFSNVFSFKLGLLSSKLYIPDIFLQELIRFVEPKVYDLLIGNTQYLIETHLTSTGLEIYELYVENPVNTTNNLNVPFELRLLLNRDYPDTSMILFPLVSALFNPPVSSETNQEFALIFKDYFVHYFHMTLPVNNITTSFVQGLISGNN
jgi:hypothetical protein